MLTTISEAATAVEAPDETWRARARARLDQLTMPRGALGRLMDLAEDLAGMTRSLDPPVARRAVVVMAGDHGVTEQGVSQYPREVTVQMVRNFAAGGAGINALAEPAGARVVVVDMGVAGDLSDLVASGRVLDRRIAPGTACMTEGPAMTREQAEAAVAAGIDVARALGPDIDVFATGEMGIGNTTPSSALVSVFCHRPPVEVTGRGTGIDDARWRHKVSVIERALEVNRPDPSDPMDALAKVGGFELAGLAGLIVGAAAQRKPVIIDGFISAAAALVAQALVPVAADYMIAAHASVECGHGAALARLGKKPLLDLGLRLGEGTGAALAFHLVDAAARVLTKIATFEEAAVSRASEAVEEVPS